MDGQLEKYSTKEWNKAQSKFISSCEDITNFNDKGMWKQDILQGDSVIGLETKPRICGVDDGVSNRMDRIKCLGNAVVPQVAEVFARAIKKFT